MGRFLMMFAALAFLAADAVAVLKVDPVFSSNMVLQQERPIAFFGSADPGSSVTVEFNGKKVTVKAGDDGKWRAEFPAVKAGETAYMVRISDGKKSVTLNDVLVGEVWFCSGQSNMQMPVGKVFRRGWSAENCEEEVRNATDPQIRYAFQRLVSSQTDRKPARYSQAMGWVKCSPDVAHYFSATAYFFGRKLRQDLKVPIGLVNASWGGTRIEPWISEEGYKQAGLDYEAGQIDRFKMTPEEKKAFEAKEQERFSREMAAWYPNFEKAEAAAKNRAAGWADPAFDDSAWKKWNNQDRYNKFVVRWYRMKFQLPKSMQNQKVRLSIGKVGETADVYLNGKRIGGWKPFDAEKSKRISLELAADAFQPGENVIAVRTENFFNSSTTNNMNSIRQARLSAGKARFALNKWVQADEYNERQQPIAGKRAPGFINIPYKSHQFPGALYNGMTDAWTKLPVRGVIWYQGCSNAGQQHYYPLHKALIADWRAKWNNPDMPFLIVQLAGYEPGRANNWKNSDPNRPSGYALTRDIQQQMLKIPNVGLACAIDIGEAANIHPANKQDVGRRLALEAERIAYGKKIVSRGPLFRAAKEENGALRVSFDNAEGGLKTSDGKAPNGFAVAGADKKFVWADAKIDGDTVLVSSPSVPAPKYVRYAYVGYRGDCNLRNQADLPAYPFRSDAIDYAAVK